MAGAIPLLRPLRESLAGDRVHRVLGIVNGTTNFILSRMDATGAGFDESLDEAHALGYAEADPTADVDGFDAAAKAAILAGLAFHTRVTAADVYREGITEVTAADIASAKAMGCTVKLLAICERDRGHASSVRVHPAMIPRTHPLAGVGDAFNAVFVEAEAAGSLMFYGRGAGGAPTASAVLGDLVAVARNRLNGGRGAGESAYADLRDPADGRDRRPATTSRLDVADKAGRARRRRRARSPSTTSASRRCGRRAAATTATLVLVTHAATDAALADDRRASSAQMPFVRRAASVMRVEGCRATDRPQP